MSNNNDQSIFERFQELCADLNMDKTASDEAWHAYQRIGNTYSLEGDGLHWLACALYVACRTCTLPTVSRDSYSEGNYVSLTRLLRSCKLSLVQFFSKMKKWADMANLSQDMRDKVDRLERSFNVTTVIFKKFEPIYRDIFKDPFKGPPRPARSRKQRRLPCTSSEVFSFCWTLFVRAKGNFTPIAEDLVNSFHLLLCCVDLMFSNALLADRRDLLNLDFAGLPSDFNSKDYTPPTSQPCILDLLCKRHQGIYIDARGIKEHWLTPHIRRLIEKKVLKGKSETLTSLLDTQNFEPNSKAINKEYEEHVLNVGDFDERVFLGENASEEMGTGLSEVNEKVRFERHLQQHIKETKSLLPSTPLTNRKYLQDKDAAYVTPISTATQSVSRLHTLLSGRKAEPSETLSGIFKDCVSNPEVKIKSRIKEMGETFCTCHVMPSDDHPGSHIDFAKKRLQLAENLYWKALENIMNLERKRLPSNFDFSNMLDHDGFHRSLFACCLEIVIFSYNSQRSFPWVLQIFNLQPFSFYKVIELLIRAEDGLSRDVVKHLNHIEEQILESLAWKSESPIWNVIASSGLPVPSCEDVLLPRQLNTTSGPSQLVSSPMANPAIRRITGDRTVKKDGPQSPVGVTVAERFQSPSAGSTARRRLFTANTIASATINHGDSNSVSTTSSGNAMTETNVTSSTTANAIMSPGRTLSITLQPVQSDKGITFYVPAQITRSPVQQQVLLTASVANTNVTPVNSVAKPTAVQSANKAKRTGSLGLFFRKVYHLAGVRLKELCDRLGILDDELRRKIWTCFEYSLMQHTDLMCDRHLDQFLMCAVYVICKVTKQDRSFQEIMKCYRLQPQAASHVYRSVLLNNNKKRRNSGSSDNSKNGSGSSSPVPSDKDGKNELEKDDKESKRAEQLSTIRSSSTLPVPHPSSQPPTPTRLAGTGTHFEFEERGDLIMFYNTVYVPKHQKFAYKFSQSTNGLDSPPLSPLPRLNAHPQSPWRRVSSKHSLYISPLTNTNFPPSPKLSYSFNKSPAKDLIAINNFVKSGEKKVGKRIFQDGSDSEKSPKRMCEDLTLRKIQNVITERQGNGLPE